jgi:hypothetical protein
MFFGQILINLYLYLFVYMHVYECYVVIYLFSCIHLLRDFHLLPVNFISHFPFWV